MTNNDATVNSALSKIITIKDLEITSRKQNLFTYLAFGEKSSELKRTLISTKLYGIELARRFPASQEMDPALRCNCTWLYEALNTPGHSEGDILKVLGITGIEDICRKSGNPTRIKSLYRQAKAKAVKLAA
ncbi:hypothetical protein E4L95_15010 [Paracoccus liaowanqingii]|uniref:Uncharacterized protein n=1 Tax=Paracoccus liaowanqingii TaxID=2560053 RepID=A0A4Z1C766_9RHOB|nr:hypothetical protein [Paracoccus liaowanqingii]TGN55492.1 hypothetical protein E4L95_15010 [Paracoccus liaowanqingii]